MPYRLNQDETIPRGLLRIVREEVDFAIAQFRSRTDEGLHEGRKCIKKLRAVARILGLDQENAVLGEIGRSLSVFRDAAAMVETVDSLGEAGASVREELVRRRDAAARQRGRATAVARAMTSLRTLRRWAACWNMGEGGFSIIEPGLRKTYRDGRRALARAKEHPTAEHFHDLRKRVKNHWYHVRLLEIAFGDATEQREARLRDMQEWLGDDHNLAVLYELIAAEPAAFPDHSDVYAEVGRRQRELRENALAAGELLYAEKPQDLVKRLAERWASGG